MKIIIQTQGTMAIYEQIVNQLKNDIVRPDFVLTIEGRADGILTEEKGVTIDEIKGVYKKLEHMECPIFVHQAQAMCYAYIYAKEHELREITVQMTYCNLESEEIRRFPSHYSTEELKEWFEQLISEYRKWCEFQIRSRD